MIAPTVGRIVWYYPTQPLDPTIPLAAIICSVVSDQRVYLVVFDGYGRQLDFGFQPPSIPLIQDNDEIPAGGGYCAWMPYQVGQAKKVEQLEARLHCATEK